MDLKTFRAIVSEELDKRTAFLQRARIDKPPYSIEIEIDLSDEQKKDDPKSIAFPFKSIQVEEATDSAAHAYIRLGTNESHQGSTKMRDGSSYVGDFLVDKAFLHWPAQPGKKLKLIAYPEGEFRSGRIQSVNAGGVNINTGSSFSSGIGSIPATTSVEVLPVKTNRGQATFQNRGTVPMYLGEQFTMSSGIVLYPGQSIQWNNTAALWAYVDTMGFNDTSTWVTLDETL